MIRPQHPGGWIVFLGLGLLLPRTFAGTISYNSPTAGPHALYQDSSYEYHYDRNGSVIRQIPRQAGDEVRFLYDSSLHLRTQIRGVSRTDQLYDANGEKIASLLADGTTYTYVGGTRMVQGSSSEAPRALLGYLDAELSNAGEVQFYAKDHLGSVVGAATRSGIEEAKDATIFGGEFYRARASIDLRPATDLDFTGHDLHDGLLDYGARTKASNAATFLQADTEIPDAGSSRGLNRYAYVANNPINFVDPDGHKPRISSILRAPENLGRIWSAVRRSQAVEMHPAQLQSWELYASTALRAQVVGPEFLHLGDDGSLAIRRSDIAKDGAWRHRRNVLSKLEGILGITEPDPDYFVLPPPYEFRDRLERAGFYRFVFTSKEDVRALHETTYLRWIAAGKYPMLDIHDIHLHLAAMVEYDLTIANTSRARQYAQLALDFSDTPLAPRFAGVGSDNLNLFTASDIDAYFSTGTLYLSWPSSLDSHLFQGTAKVGAPVAHQLRFDIMDWLGASSNPMAGEIKPELEAITKQRGLTAGAVGR